MFHFKQFSIDQSGCAMKVNTDGVLLGALVATEQMETILDIGTGTGVIALMLAQRYINAQIDAVEIDPQAAETAGKNFDQSPFADRLTCYPLGFEQFFEQYPQKKYDLIVANPPFHIQSLKSPEGKINQAKHAGDSFFEKLMEKVDVCLMEKGKLSLILPLQTAELVVRLANRAGLPLTEIINIFSFRNSHPHRQIISFSRDKRPPLNEEFVIYNEPKKYSTAYQILLKDFLTIF